MLSFPLTEADTGIKNLEEDLHKIASWCCENNLLVNPDKTKFMIIGTRQLINELDVNISISFMGKIPEPVDFAKDLGLLMDSHLSYDKHISNLVSSCLYKLCQINRVKNNFDKGTLTMIITSLVISKLLYCSTVCTIYNMSGRVVSDIQTRTEGESLYIRYNTAANVVNGLKNDSSYEFIHWRSNFKNKRCLSRENQS